MPEQTDPTRELVRRAYADVPYTSDLDIDGGLADVVRRAGRPRHHEDDAATAVTDLEPRRTRRRFAVVGTFAAAVVTILAVYAASAGTRPHGAGTAPSQVGSSRTSISDVPVTPPTGSGRATPTNPSSSTYAGSPGASRFAGDDPVVLPSSCADAWVLTLAGNTFRVTPQSRSACVPLPVDRLWVLDAASGNGLINPGDAVIWPVVPAGGAKGPVQPPFTFTPGGWSGPVKGHVYQVIYVDAAAAMEAKPGDDSYAAYLNAHMISRYVIG